MDGFDTQEGVIIIRRTTAPMFGSGIARRDVSDRQITVNLPDVKGREENSARSCQEGETRRRRRSGGSRARHSRLFGRGACQCDQRSALLAARRGLRESRSPNSKKRDKVAGAKNAAASH